MSVDLRLTHRRTRDQAVSVPIGAIDPTPNHSLDNRVLRKFGFCETELTACWSGRVPALKPARRSCGHRQRPLITTPRRSPTGFLRRLGETLVSVEEPDSCRSSEYEAWQHTGQSSVG